MPRDNWPLAEPPEEEEPYTPPTSVETVKGAKLFEMLKEFQDRKIESLQLYEPLKIHERFHASRARERILRGGNRAGKTTPVMVELARAITGQDPHGKYPLRDGRVFLVGAKLQHLADVFYAKLFQKGAFRLVNDRGKMRAWRPWDDGYDKSKLILCPPLIPSRFVREMVFEHRARKQLTYASLTTGWEVMLFSSEADPPVGTDVDLVIIDEDVKNPDWIGEMQARILDRDGKFIWSTLPYSKNTILRDMCDRCKDEMVENPTNPRAEEFVLRMRDNPYLPPEAKEDAQRQWADMGYLLEMRDLGEFATNHFLVWPDFDMRTHGIDLKNPQRMGLAFDEREVSKLFPGGVIPDDWARYMIVDPGRRVLAVLFAVVPPPRLGLDIVIIEDELYLRDATADIFGKAVARKLERKMLVASIIDDHGGRIHDTGGGLLVREQYSRALKANGVKAKVTGYGFISGVDDIEAREQAVASWIAIRQDGTTKLRVVEGRCPAFEREIGRFQRQSDAKGNIKDQGDYRRDAHQMANLGYLAAYDPKWRRPDKNLMTDERAKREKAALERVNKNKPKEDGGGVILGPLGSTRSKR